MWTTQISGIEFVLCFSISLALSKTLWDCFFSSFLGIVFFLPTQPTRSTQHTHCSEHCWQPQHHVFGQFALFWAAWQQPHLPARTTNFVFAILLWQLAFHLVQFWLDLLNQFMPNTLWMICQYSTLPDLCLWSLPPGLFSINHLYHWIWPELDMAWIASKSESNALWLPPFPPDWALIL